RLARLPRIGAERLATELETADHGGVAHGTVDHDTGPPVGPSQLGDEVADQRGVQTRRPVDDQHAALAGFAEHRFEQCVVPVAAHRRDPPAEPDAAADIAELRVAAAHGV